MSIPQEIIDEVRRRADVVEVIGGHVPLKRAGSNYKGLCPFHKEKSPSFNVNPSLQIFRCFGCGEGGNVFSFLMKHENLTFPQAVETLARRYGVEIPRSDEDRSQRDARERLYDAMGEATDFYHQRLLREGGDSLIGRYLAMRGLTPAQVKTFKLGWAPEGWEELYRQLARKGYTDTELEQAGLAQKSSRGNYIDRFRGRLMFPITGQAGRVIAFGGRIVIDDEKAPKYLNSPETPIYHKSNVLYGYHEGARAAREAGLFIVVEGYMDTLALHAAG
ncbi:MAG: DNA primase, partial [Nitrospinae bacterium]|nr:DNA primase [Nitrospinota bacterium]